MASVAHKPATSGSWTTEHQPEKNVDNPNSKVRGRKYNTWERVLEELKERPNPLLELAHAVEDKQNARMRYDQALRECGAAGISNQKMAQVIGMTEAGVRAYRLRHDLL